MEHLPLVGWADVATKRDLDQFDLRIEACLERELRLMNWRLLTAMVAVASLAVAAVRL